MASVFDVHRHLQSKAVQKATPWPAGRRLPRSVVSGTAERIRDLFRILYPFASANATYANSLPVDQRWSYSIGGEELPDDEEVREADIFDDVLLRTLKWFAAVACYVSCSRIWLVSLETCLSHYMIDPLLSKTSSTASSKRSSARTRPHCLARIVFEGIEPNSH